LEKYHNTNSFYEQTIPDKWRVYVFLVFLM
jgi:hypothetical protein